MGRIIIDNQSGLSDSLAVSLVKSAMAQGKISKNTKGVKHYCWCTVFEIGTVFTRRKKVNQTSDSFIVQDTPSR